TDLFAKVSEGKVALAVGEGGEGIASWPVAADEILPAIQVILQPATLAGRQCQEVASIRRHSPVAVRETGHRGALQLLAGRTQEQRRREFQLSFAEHLNVLATAPAVAAFTDDKGAV